MEIVALAHLADRRFIDRLEIVAHGTRIVIADAPGDAVHLTITGADGVCIHNVTIRGGPSGPMTDEGTDE